jgi:hypothetical protein
MTRNLSSMSQLPPGLGGLDSTRTKSTWCSRVVGGVIGGLMGQGVPNKRLN